MLDGQPFTELVKVTNQSAKNAKERQCIRKLICVSRQEMDLGPLRKQLRNKIIRNFKLVSKVHKQFLLIRSPITIHRQHSIIQ